MRQGTFLRLSAQIWNQESANLRGITTENLQRGEWSRDAFLG